MTERIIGRSDYVCDNCGGPTVKCRYCDNMARGAGAFNGDGDQAPDYSSSDEPTKSKVANYFKERWTNELCSEHDGTVPDFSKATLRIADLSEFADLMKPRQKNYSGAAKKATFVAGKTLAVTLGGGPFAIAAAAGSGLGGRAGYGIANNYLKDIPDYNFVKVQEGLSASRHSVIVINGLLSKKNPQTVREEEWFDLTHDWVSGLRGTYDDDDIWHLNWDAKSLANFGSWAGASTGAGILAASSGLSNLVLSVSGNPWYSAMLKAQKTGAILAEALSRTEGTTFTLMGHSLGARVIFFALMALSTKDERYVRDVVLMGGAVGRDKVKSWEKAGAAVTGTMYNCHSAHDDTLRHLYQMANAWLSKPAGLGAAMPPAFNIDCTDFISGHTVWKANLPRVLERISDLGEA